MNTCPHHKVREGLPALTDRIAKLPVDERGYPVPYFVAFVDGKPDFRLTDSKKYVACIKERRCWVCGDPLGKYLAFTIGPMCAINRTTAEPPEHFECAEWSVKGCPFLSKPQMVRREDELTEALDQNVSGIMIKRNPGATCIWVTKSYSIFRDHQRKPLIKIGEPESVTWWKLGRPATRDEVMESIDSGLPRLYEFCADAHERQEVDNAKARMMHLLPKP